MQRINVGAGYFINGLDEIITGAASDMSSKDNHIRSQQVNAVPDGDAQPFRCLTQHIPGDGVACFGFLHHHSTCDEVQIPISLFYEGTGTPVLDFLARSARHGSA